jgi:hypothetical protein
MGEIFRQKERAVDAHSAEVLAKSKGARQDGVFILAMLVCLVLTGLNVTGKMPLQTVVEAKSNSEAQMISYQTVNFAVREIDAFHLQHGRLPRSLTEVGAPSDPRWNYQVLGDDQYSILFEAGEFSLAYESSLDADQFFAEVRRYR